MQLQHILPCILQNGTASGSRQSGSGGKDSTRSATKGGPKAGTTASATTQRATIEINSANFPPLQNSHSVGEDGPIPTPGYHGPFIKYSFDDIINIVKDIKDTSLPASIKPVRPFFLSFLMLMFLLEKYLVNSFSVTSR